MSNTTLMKNLLAGAALFVLGALTVWLARPTAVEAQSPRVYELRTYRCLPGRLEALKTRFRDHTLKLFAKHGMKNIGYWVPADAPDSQNTPDLHHRPRQPGRGGEILVGIQRRHGVEDRPRRLGEGR